MAHFCFGSEEKPAVTIQDVLKRGIGEYMGGDKLEWARRLKNKTIHRMIADCFAFFRDHDDFMLDELRKGFA